MNLPIVFVYITLLQSAWSGRSPLPPNYDPAQERWPYYTLFWLHTYRCCQWLALYTLEITNKLTSAQSPKAPQGGNVHQSCRNHLPAYLFML